MTRGDLNRELYNMRDNIREVLNMSEGSVRNTVLLKWMRNKFKKKLGANLKQIPTTCIAFSNFSCHSDNSYLLLSLKLLTFSNDIFFSL